MTGRRWALATRQTQRPPQDGVKVTVAEPLGATSTAVGANRGLPYTCFSADSPQDAQSKRPGDSAPRGSGGIGRRTSLRGWR